MRIAEIDSPSIINKTRIPAADYACNPYIGCPHACLYCYACFMRRFTHHSEPWGQFLDVKYWPALKNAHKYDGSSISIGTVTDPYNPYEAQFERTRALLEQLQGSTARILLLTKSDLVLRDLDLLRSLPGVRVCFSINTLDEDFRAQMDKAPSIGRRLQALKTLHEAGIATAVFISPIFPELTDVPAICDAVRGLADEIWLENLNLRGGFRGDVMAWIAKEHPELLPLYQEIYSGGGGKGYWLALQAELQAWAQEQKLPIKNYFFHEAIRKPA